MHQPAKGDPYLTATITVPLDSRGPSVTLNKAMKKTNNRCWRASSQIMFLPTISCLTESVQNILKNCQRVLVKLSGNDYDTRKNWFDFCGDLIPDPDPGVSLRIWQNRGPFNILLTAYNVSYAVKLFRVVVWVQAKSQETLDSGPQYGSGLHVYSEAVNALAGLCALWAALDFKSTSFCNCNTLKK